MEGCVGARRSYNSGFKDLALVQKDQNVQIVHLGLLVSETVLAFGRCVSQ